jgi:hypothetical protein
MVREKGYADHFTAWAGLIIGPLAWLIATELNYALALWQCKNGIYPVPWIALLLALIALAGGAISLQHWRRREAALSSLSFAAAIATLASGLFAIVILLQGLAGLIFTGCER